MRKGSTETLDDRQRPTQEVDTQYDVPKSPPQSNTAMRFNDTIQLRALKHSTEYLVPFRRPSRLAITLVLCAMTAAAAGREVAITIDDLPRGGDAGPRTLSEVQSMTKRLLKPFHEQKIPVIGFVNEGRADFGPDGLRQILDLWLDAGAGLGNHSYSHLDINMAPLDEYTADIVKGEPILRQALAAHGKKLEFYRHPFLFTGPTPQIKKELQTFLDQHGYRVAPVTIDDDDYEFARLYTNPEFKERVRAAYLPYMESEVAAFERMSVEVVGREFPQILLIHASQLNADLMPELLAMFRRRGYSFISLDHALTDPAYRLPDEYAGRGGISWIHRWAKTKGLAHSAEPEPPAWVTEAFAAASK